jgi:DNA-binding protein HU-beta
MNKAEMIEKVAKLTGLTQKDSKAAVDAIFDTEPGRGIIAIELDADRKVTISGFGTFETRHRKARTGRNPRTGEQIQIPASKAPVFKAGKPFKDRVKV